MSTLETIRHFNSTNDSFESTNAIVSGSTDIADLCNNSTSLVAFTNTGSPTSLSRIETNKFIQLEDNKTLKLRKYDPGTSSYTSPNTADVKALSYWLKTPLTSNFTYGNDSVASNFLINKFNKFFIYFHSPSSSSSAKLRIRRVNTTNYPTFGDLISNIYINGFIQNSPTDKGNNIDEYSFEFNYNTNYHIIIEFSSFVTLPGNTEFFGDNDYVFRGGLNTFEILGNTNVTLPLSQVNTLFDFRAADLGYYTRPTKVPDIDLLDFYALNAGTTEGNRELKFNISTNLLFHNTDIYKIVINDTSLNIFKYNNIPTTSYSGNIRTATINSTDYVADQTYNLRVFVDELGNTSSGVGIHLAGESNTITFTMPIKYTPSFILQIPITETKNTNLMSGTNQSIEIKAQRSNSSQEARARININNIKIFLNGSDTGETIDIPINKISVSKTITGITLREGENNFTLKLDETSTLNAATSNTKTVNITAPASAPASDPPASRTANPVSSSMSLSHEVALGAQINPPRGRNTARSSFAIINAEKRNAAVFVRRNNFRG